jgi:hypothetical protein
VSNSKTVTLTLDLDDVVHLMLWVGDASEAMTEVRAGQDEAKLSDARAYKTMENIYKAFNVDGSDNEDP